MRALPLALLLLATPAFAQFANRTLGLSGGYWNIDGATQGTVPWTVPVALEGSLYIENHFDFVIRVPVAIMQSTTREQLVGVAPHIGFRYLLAEETVRPYVGTGLTFLSIFGRSTGGFIDNTSVGPEVNLGLDYMVADSVSVGARGVSQLFVRLGAAPGLAFGGVLAVATHF